MIDNRVDFPQPDGPTSTMNSPASASRSMPFRTSTDPKFLYRLETVNDAIDQPLSDPAVSPRMK